MKDFTPKSKTVEFVKYCKEMGFNIMSVTLDPETNMEASSAFASHLKDNGMGMIIIRGWGELEGIPAWPPLIKIPEAKKSRKLCPYSHETRQYWEKRIAEDYKKMPDLYGYKIIAGSYYYAKGAPWLCDCENCSKLTEKEKTRDAIRLIANILGKYSGILIWETTQDDPGGQYEEMECFKNMTGEIPENAVITFKWYYWDYHSGYPRHPLFETLKKDKNGKSPYGLKIQLSGEYRGVNNIPWSMVKEWSRVMHDAHKTGQVCLFVDADLGFDNWDHPLNMVNWHAVSRYMKDPLSDPDDISMEWAVNTYGKEAAPTVIKVLDKMTLAAKRMFEFKGLWTQNHSYLPDLEYLDTRLCGPCRQSPRRKGMMGHTWPLDMYTPERASEIKKEDSTRLCFTPEKITKELKREMIEEKKQAIDLAREAAELWKSLKNLIGGKEYEEILGLLSGNIDDSILWFMAMDMYMDLKIGILTEERIDEILMECKEKDLKGTILGNPLDAADQEGEGIITPSTLKLFSEELRKEIRTPELDSLESVDV